MEENEGEVKGKYNDIKREVALFFSLKCLISFFRIKMFRFEYIFNYNTLIYLNIIHNRIYETKHRVCKEISTDAFSNR